MDWGFWILVGLIFLGGFGLGFRVGAGWMYRQWRVHYLGLGLKGKGNG